MGAIILGIIFGYVIGALMGLGGLWVSKGEGPVPWVVFIALIVWLGSMFLMHCFWINNYHGLAVLVGVAGTVSCLISSYIIFPIISFFESL